MTRIRRSVSIARSPAEVFARLVDLDRLSDWATIVVATRGHEVPLRVGSRFEQTVRIAGVEVDSRWHLTELEPDRRLAYEAESHVGSLRMRQSVVPEGGGTRLDLEIDYEVPGGAFGEFLDRVLFERRNEEEAERSLGNLKSLLEGDAPPERER